MYVYVLKGGWSKVVGFSFCFVFIVGVVVGVLVFLYFGIISNLYVVFEGVGVCYILEVEGGERC